MVRSLDKEPILSLHPDLESEQSYIDYA